jgi:hypothetical protein
VRLVVAAGPVQGDVGQEPVAGVGLALERQAGFPANPAVRSVAPGYVTGAELDAPARGVAERGVHGAAVLGEAHQFGALLDRSAQLAHAGSQQPLGFALGEVEGKAVP